MAINLGSAYGKVILDASGVKSGVSTATASLEGLSKLGMTIGREMQNIGRAMTIGISLPLIGIGAASIKAATDLKTARDNIGAAFGGMSSDMEKWSKSAADALGLSQRAALDGASTFGLMFSEVGIGAGKAEEMSKKMVGLAVDLATFSKTDPSKVFVQLMSGLTGSGEALSKYGVDLSKTTVIGKAMEMGLADANGELSEAALVQARYALILEHTTKLQGLFAEKTDDMGKDLAIMKAKLENALEVFGLRMIPIVIRVVEAITRLADAFAKLPVPVQDALLVLGGLLILMGPVIGFIGSIVSIVAGIAGAISLLAGAGISLGAIVGVIGSVILPLVLVGLAIAAVAGAIVFLYLAWTKNLFGIRTAVEKFWENLKTKFKEGWDSLVETSTERAAAMGATMKVGAEGIQSAWASMMGWLQRAWQNTMDYLARMAAWGRNAIFSVFRVDWAALGRSIINGIVSGFNSGLSLLVEAARKAAQAVLDTIQKTLNAHSPSMETFKLGLMAGEGFTLGMARGIDPRAIARMVARPVQQMSTSQQQQLTVNLAGGLSLQQASVMIADSEEQMLENMQKLLGGG